MSTLLPTDLHSAEWFGDQRDFWWSADYLALVAKRLNLAAFPRILDAGSGVGHWGRALLPHLPEATLVGVDREPVWVTEATARAAAAGLGARASYRAGDVNALPFADASFDLVTCQTVLIHMADVRASVRELLRVLRPGGLLLVAEPNNLANALALGSARHGAPVDEIVELLRFQLICERGKAALGEGDNSVGELLPGLLAELGLVDVQVSLSDRTATLFPPYATRAQQAIRDDILEHHAGGHWLWKRADSQRYFLAGGGRADEFDAIWQRGRRSAAKDVEALQAGTFHVAGGAMQYVISARKR